jgi:hypothetical protein
MNFSTLLRAVLNLLVRILLLSVSLVFFTALLTITLTVLLLWLLRSLWARLRGQSAPRPVFTVWRQAQQVYRTGRPFGTQRHAEADVIDVSARTVEGDATERLNSPGRKP